MRWALAAALALAVGPAPALSQVVPPATPELPVLGPPAPRGGGLDTWPVAAVRPHPKAVDGDVSDWTGAPSRLAGTAVYSAGEYVYQDYLMDDHGADDGQDAERDAVTDPAAAAEPRTSRLEALSQALGDEFGAGGAGVPEAVAAKVAYGDASYPKGLEGNADIEEVRVAADASRLLFMVRTEAMTTPGRTAVLVLLDSEPGGSYPAPGGIETRAEWAFLVAGDRVVASTYKGAPSSCARGCPAVKVATNPSAFDNAVEMSVDRSLLGPLPQRLPTGVATGVLAADGSGLEHVAPNGAAGDLLNVAFRADEPVRMWMDHDQAFALRGGDIDRYLAPIDLDRLAGGYTEGFRPRSGYYERVYDSRSPVSEERVVDGYAQGRFQFYGLYLPRAYRPGARLPATFWLHYSGGRANDLAAWVPGALRHLGELRDNIVVSPGARGMTSAYVGRGLDDFLECWDDAIGSLPIDRDRVYLSGYSMGGLGTHLLGLLYPDRFAAAFSTVGTPFLGPPMLVAPPGTDTRLNLGEVAPNARDLPYVMYHGTDDEVVPVTDEVQQAQRLGALGYRYRLYLFPGYEHYSFAVVDDQWEQAANYLDGFRRDPNPARVTYRVWPALEHTVNTTNTPVPLHHAFDGAYWVSGLAVRGGDPADPATVGTIDAQSLARGGERIAPAAEASAGGGTPGQQTAFAMTGQRWATSGRVERRNRFVVTLANLATATLDLGRMAVSTSRAITAHVGSDAPAELRLAGSWTRRPVVSGAQATSYDGRTLTVELGSGEHELVIRPH